MVPVTPPATDHRLARYLAESAGDLLIALRKQMGYADPAALRDSGDRRSHELIVDGLARCRPDDAVLSEEGPDDGRRLGASRVWIVDPLDGTREYGEGRTDWAVHVALWARGSLVAGAVALPAQHRAFGTDSPPPYPPPPVSPPPTVPPAAVAASGPSSAGRLRLVVSRTRPPAFLEELVAELGGADVVSMGSAGAKITAVVDGTVDGYLHVGDLHDWDSAAPVAVAAATGLHASRLDGSPLEYNRPDPRLPDLLVCREELAPRLLAALARCA